MTVVVGTTIGGGFDTLYKRTNRRALNKDTEVVAKQRDLYRREDKTRIKGESYLPQARQLWDSLTDQQKYSWGAAADYTDLRAYNLFVQDTIYRLRNNIEGLATPNINHQYLIGHLHIPEGAGEVLLRQAGGNKPTGNIGLYTWYKSNLEIDAGPVNTMKLIFRYWYDLGGVKTEKTRTYNYTLQTDWTSIVGSEAVLDNAFDGWELDLHAIGVKGDFYFDNTYAEDWEQVTSRDRYCNNAERYWNKGIGAEGVTITSIYPED